MDEILNTSGENLEAAASNDVLQSVSDNQGGGTQVPVHVVQSLRGENQQLKENLKVFAEHLELLRSNQSKTETQQPDQFQKMSDDDVLTVGEAKKFVGNLQRQYQMSIEELKMTQVHPDYTDTIKKYLPQVLKEDPELRFEIENARNPYKMAYYLAKKSSAYVDETRAKQKNSDAQRIISNSQKTGSLSAVGSTSPISQASNWKSMSDDEFRKQMNKNLGHF